MAMAERLIGPFEQRLAIIFNPTGQVEISETLRITAADGCALFFTITTNLEKIRCLFRILTI